MDPFNRVKLHQALEADDDVIAALAEPLHLLHRFAEHQVSHRDIIAMHIGVLVTNELHRLAGELELRVSWECNDPPNHVRIRKREPERVEVKRVEKTLF